MKQVEFDIELVKKIQSGEVKGFVKTRDGRIARFLGEIHNNRYPLVFVYLCDSGEECVLCNTINGLSYYGGWKSNDDIIIEIEEPKQKCQFYQCLKRDLANLFTKTRVNKGEQEESRKELIVNNH